MISAVILTKNEEENVARCLRSLSWVDEIVIVDDFSHDKTIEKIKNDEAPHKNAKVFSRKLGDDFAKQRNFGLEKATGEWVLFIDADEVVGKELKEEIRDAIEKQKADAFLIKRKDYFMGSWLSYGETRGIKLVRLAKKNMGKWTGGVHETWQIASAVGSLINPILHYPHKNLRSFIRSINAYTDIAAAEKITKGEHVANWEILSYPVGKFLQNYVGRLGFLDGMPGLIMAMMMSWHSFLVRAKVWVKQNQNH